jgi:hypothetical protein
MDSETTAKICADIEDALERVKRGEMCREDFEAYKRDRKQQLMVLTPHATFTDGVRQNKSAVPSGLSMYDIDHISDPRGFFNTMVRERCAELGIVMAHVTPSTEGLRLIFEVPEGMSLAEAQKWMSEQLGDSSYDGSVKDYARCSFVVPRAYLLYIDEEELCKQREVKAVSQNATVDIKILVYKFVTFFLRTFLHEKRRFFTYFLEMQNYLRNFASSNEGRGKTKTKTKRFATKTKR